MLILWGLINYSNVFFHLQVDLPGWGGGGVVIGDSFSNTIKQQI